MLKTCFSICSYICVMVPAVLNHVSCRMFVHAQQQVEHGFGASPHRLDEVVDVVSKGCQGQLRALGSCQGLQPPLRRPALCVAQPLPQPPALHHDKGCRTAHKALAKCCRMDSALYKMRFHSMQKSPDVLEMTNCIRLQSLLHCQLPLGCQNVRSLTM